MSLLNIASSHGSSPATADSRSLSLVSRLNSLVWTSEIRTKMVNGLKGSWQIFDDFEHSSVGTEFCHKTRVLWQPTVKLSWSYFAPFWSWLKDLVLIGLQIRVLDRHDGRTDRSMSSDGPMLYSSYENIFLLQVQIVEQSSCSSETNWH